MRIPIFLKQVALACAYGFAAALFAAGAISLATGDRGLRSQKGGGSGEGSSAEAPTEIPPGGWRDILWRTYGEVDKDRVLAVAAGVTFYGLLAVFPAVTAFVSLYGLVADPGTITEQLSVAEGVLPSGAIEILRDQIVRISTGNETKLGLAFVIGLVLSAWSANAGVKAVFDALNVAYGEDEKRSFIRLNLTSLIFTLGILVFAVIAIVAVAAIPVVLDYLYLGDAVEWLISLGRWPIKSASCGRIASHPTLRAALPFSSIKPCRTAELTSVWPAGLTHRAGLIRQRSREPQRQRDLRLSQWRWAYTRSLAQTTAPTHFKHDRPIASH